MITVKTISMLSEEEFQSYYGHYYGYSLLKYNGGEQHYEFFETDNEMCSRLDDKNVEWAMIVKIQGHKRNE